MGITILKYPSEEFSSVTPEEIWKTFDCGHSIEYKVTETLSPMLCVDSCCEEITCTICGFTYRVDSWD